MHSEVDGPVHYLQAVLQGVQILVKLFLNFAFPQSEVQVPASKNKDKLQLVQSVACRLHVVHPTHSSQVPPFVEGLASGFSKNPSGHSSRHEEEVKW